jgi:hypothetical protein
MAHKQVLFCSEAREKIFRAATALVDTIRITLGPKSSSAPIKQKWRKPLVCNDGVTIANEFHVGGRGRNAVRSRLSLTLFRHSSGEDGSRAGESLHFVNREKIARVNDVLP